VAIRAVFFDLGGVIVRTEFQSPRQHLAERLNQEYEDLVRLVFESETSRMASLGKLSVEEHWAAVVEKLHLPVTESKAVYAEFFAGDFLDRELVAFIDSLRPAHKTGLITNAWGDMRSYLGREKVTGAFDVLIVSAEVGVLKPQPRIYELALAQAGVTAQEAIFVDDTAVNVEAAAKLGMTGILFKDREQTISEINRLI
jgi:epoxide hydrolase-like predicted phosphatase